MVFWISFSKFNVYLDSDFKTKHSYSLQFPISLFSLICNYFNISKLLDQINKFIISNEQPSGCQEIGQFEFVAKKTEGELDVQIMFL